MLSITPRTLFCFAVLPLLALVGAATVPAAAQPRISLSGPDCLCGSPVNVAEMIRSGEAQATGTRGDIGSPQGLFSGRLFRSAATNPASVTLTFNHDVTVNGFRVWFTNADGNPAHRWQVEAANSLLDLETKQDSYRVLSPWKDVPADERSARQLSRPATARCLRLAAQRLTGDGYVHFRGWELFERSAQPAPRADIAPIAPPVVLPAPHIPLMAQTGEIVLCGTISAVNAATGRLTLQVTSFSLPDGKESQLSSPKAKTVVLTAQTVWCGKTGELKPGAQIEVAGPDNGSGQPLVVRAVSQP